MPYADAANFDTGSTEWRDICLARWICELPRDYREEWIGKFARRAGMRNEDAVAAARLQLELDVEREWKRRHEWHARGSSRTAGAGVARGDADPLAGSGDTFRATPSPGPIARAGDVARAEPDPPPRPRGQLSLV